MNRITPESHFLFISRRNPHFLLPVREVINLRNKYMMNNYPYSRNALFKMERRINLGEFLQFSFESRIGETDKKKVESIRKLIRNRSFNEIILILQYISEFDNIAEFQNEK